MDEKNATRLWYPASLTKMMTAYVTFKAIREGRASLNSVVVQSANSLNQAPSRSLPMSACARQIRLLAC